MTQTSTQASDAINLVYEGLSVLTMQDDDYDLPGVAIQLLRTMGSLTDEYPIESFTDDELELITETTLACLNQLMDTAEQGEF